jgi:hypothetical protein
VFWCLFMCFHMFSLCFHCRNMYVWYISYVYQNTQVPYILHEMHCFANVFISFHCVLLQKHEFLVHFTCIPKYTCNIYSSWNALFCKCFHCVFTAKTYTSSTFHMYTKIYLYHIFYMKCTVLLVFNVFSMCFHCRNMYFWYISHVYQNTHVPYVLH